MRRGELKEEKREVLRELTDELGVDGAARFLSAPRLLVLEGLAGVRMAEGGRMWLADALDAYTRRKGQAA